MNRRQIRAEGFRQTESGAVEMDDGTRKEVLVAYQKRKQEEIMHPFLERASGVWDRAACAGDAAGAVFARRLGRVSEFSLE